LKYVGALERGLEYLSRCNSGGFATISRLGERGMPLYKLLKKSDMFVRMEVA
jgi:hypothetical protein